MTKISIRDLIRCSLMLVASLLAAGGASAGSTVQESADTSFYVSAPVCGARQPLGGLDARVVAKATEGVDALRDFVFLSQKINSLDMNGTIAWLDRQRAAEAACNAAMAMARR